MDVKILDIPRQIFGIAAEFPLAIKKISFLKISILFKSEKDFELVLRKLNISQQTDAIAVLKALAESE
jgi:hypothetical protein